MVTNIHRACVVGLLLLTACGGATEPVVTPSQISPRALFYVNDAVDIMAANSVRRFLIDWITFRLAVVDSAEAMVAQRVSDTYPAIRFAVEMLGDNHSSFRTPQDLSSQLAVTSVPFGVPVSHRLDGEIGYIHVPLFSSGTADENTAFANRIQELVHAVDGPGTCGWIVDLRGNLGGNMWPMLAGVGEVLGEGVLGFFVDPDSEVPPIVWSYENAASKSNGAVIQFATQSFPLMRPNPSVAVLWDEHTASSGEATATAFIGRPKTRSFGEPSFGLSTSNRLFRLSDGAGINLTTKTFADRAGFVYGQRIPPDVVVEHEISDQEAPDPTVGDDPVVLVGLEWLAAEGDCVVQ